MTLQVAERTHRGHVRPQNEDHMGRFVCPLGSVFIVADGMGGHAGGATASAMVVDRFQAHLSRVAPAVSMPMALQVAAQATNADIFSAATSGDPETLSMGATVVLAVLKDDTLVVGHAGDSRAYVFRDGRLGRVTRDHSLVQEMLDRNILTEQQARAHPESNIITRAVGEHPELQLEVSDPIDVRPGDALLLCTDGLSGSVDDRAIEQILRDSGESVAEATEALLDAALAAGGRDNITVQLVRF